MKTKNKFSLVLLGVAFALGLTISNVAHAATTPFLGLAATYGVLASTYTNTIAGTTITGDVGFTTGPAVAPAGSRTYYGSGDPYSAARIDQGTALTNLAVQACTFTFAPGAINLSTDTTHGTSGVYTPGVYCSDGAMSIGGPLTLDGAGTYIFRSVGALTSVVDSAVSLINGASACDVFWTPTAATTLAATTTFAGTVIADAGITVGANTSWSGRALAAQGTVTTDKDTITVPTCDLSTITVVKSVINDSSKTKTVADFSLFVNGTPVVSGMTNVFAAPATYTVTETPDSEYDQSFSGDCAGGIINLTSGQERVCIVTNDDKPSTSSGGGGNNNPVVPPIIDVVKVPSPLSLPGGAGPVTYTYTLRNIGTVPVTNVTLVGDTCSPISLISGDSDSDIFLDVDETWIHTCTKTISETHTNTVVATGWANGLSAVDVANATVVVGVPVVPPLIHVTKIPNPLTLSAGGGLVTYTERVTNPGTVALSNVQLTDDKCSPMTRVSGDTDSDSKLDVGEEWVYTCQTNLTKTTLNTAIASGEANGLTARDFAVATVVVAAATTPTPTTTIAVPSLPDTGFPPATNNLWLWLTAILSIFAVSALAYLVHRRQTE